MLEELTRRVRTLRPAGQALRLRSNFINGIKYLPRVGDLLAGTAE